METLKFIFVNNHPTSAQTNINYLWLQMVGKKMDWN